MSQSKNRAENEDKIRKQTQHPHGHITSLEEFAEEYEAEQPSQNKPQS
ncbi:MULTISPECIES: DUF6254 family protein [unclassified Paenibacillus]